MASKLNPYLSFGDTARAAMEFYREVFGGKLELNTFGEFGAAEGAAADGIMHASLETAEGYTIMASDTPPGQQRSEGASISMSLSGDEAEDGARLREYWAKLSDGGAVSVPLEKQMWGDVFGMCTDRFGIAWMVNIGQPQG